MTQWRPDGRSDRAASDLAGSGKKPRKKRPEKDSRSLGGKFSSNGTHWTDEDKNVWVIKESAHLTVTGAMMRI